MGGAFVPIARGLGRLAARHGVKGARKLIAGGARSITLRKGAVGAATGGSLYSGIRTAMRQRKGGSRTVTKRKSESSGLVLDGQDGTQNTRFSTVYKPSKNAKMYKALSAPFTFINQQQIQVAGGKGLQAVVNTLPMWHGTNNAPSNSITVGALYQTANNIASDGTHGNFVSAGMASFKYELQKCTNTIELVNQTPSIAHCVVYDCIAKVTQRQYISPFTAWNAGVGQQAGNLGAGITAAVTFPKADPTQTKMFNMTWKIARRVPFDLKSGEQHTHKWIFKPNRIVDLLYFDSTDATASFGMVKGITAATMIVSYGAISDDSNTATFSGNSTLLGVGIAPVKLAGIQTQTFITRILGSFPRITQQTSGLNTTQTHAYVQDEDQDIKDEATAGVFA